MTLIAGKTLLLPSSCTAHDGVRVANNGAVQPVNTTHDGSMELHEWALTSNRNCVLYGAPQVTYFTSGGRQVHLKNQDSGGALPVIVGPKMPGYVQVGVQTLSDCRAEGDTISPAATVVHLRVPTTPTGSRQSLLVKARTSPIVRCSNPVLEDRAQVQPIVALGWTTPAAKGEPTSTDYAVDMRSNFDSGDSSTWGTGDVDGDGVADVALLNVDGSLQVALSSTGSVVSATVAGSPLRLQGISDLSDDGRGEILVASTTEGVNTGYRFGSSTTTVYTYDGGSLSQLGGKHFSLAFNSMGRGDQWAGIDCRSGTLTQIEARETNISASTWSFSVSKKTWTVNGTKLTLRSSSTNPQSGNRFVVAATHCAGLSAIGWAFQRQ